MEERDSLGYHRRGSSTMASDTRPCPFCAEDIKVAAIVCKHCKRDVPKGEMPTTELTEVTAAPEVPRAHPTITLASGQSWTVRKIMLYRADSVKEIADL